MKYRSGGQYTKLLEAFKDPKGYNILTAAMFETAYICNQKRRCRHKKLGCSKYGGECRHTKDIRYAKYKGKPDLERIWYEYHGDNIRWEMGQ